ncbi:hypothetical protein PG997_010526 [Apiospora hydei]|uniref:Uncharacterized protein n=1 Tax=Apiospora hydei TaxID=1337664 RepID=A0ABR1VXA6_9PEZI
MGFENLCSFISSLAYADVASSPATVAIFSRPGYAAIEDVLGGASRIQVDVGANQADIDLFIAERTQTLTSNSSTLQDIKAILSEDADGMFLWVSLVIDSIKKERNDKRRKSAARNMPRGLAGAYSVALDRVLAQDESIKDVALKTLLWIANSERPLSEVELFEALSIEPGMPDLDDEDRIDGNFSLTEDCADLVISRNGQYSLLHVSLKEYLTHPPLKYAEEPIAEYWMKQSKSQAILAELCLTYLMFDTFKEHRIEAREDTIVLLEKYPLLEYAAAHWGKHVAKVSVTEKDKIMTLARDFLTDKYLLQLWGQVMSLAVGALNERVCSLCT